jgi:hypothetical protein
MCARKRLCRELGRQDSSDARAVTMPAVPQRWPLPPFAAGPVEADNSIDGGLRTQVCPGRGLTANRSERACDAVS